MSLAVAYAAILVVAIAAAMVDAIELRLPDPMTYSILAAGVVVMAIFEIMGKHQGLVRGILGGVLYGGLLLGAGLLDPRSYGLGDIKLAAGLGVWLGGGLLVVRRALRRGLGVSDGCRFRAVGCGR